MKQRLLLGVLGSLVLAACATVRPLIDGGEVRNETSAAVHNLRVVFQPTRRTAFAQEMMPGRALTLEFRAQEMKSDYADFTWLNANARECSARVDSPSCPAGLAQSTLWVVYSVTADDTVTVKLVQQQEK